MKKIIIILLAFNSIIIACRKVQEPANTFSSKNKNAIAANLTNEIDSPFTHPGIYHTQTDLDRIKNVATQQTEPYYTAYLAFKGLNLCQLTYTPNPVVNETYGVGQFQVRNDSQAAYYQALLGHITGNVAYFNKSKEIINAWTNTLQTFDQTDHLSAGPAAINFSNAGEILKTNSSVWDSTSNAKLVSMLENIIYPALAHIHDANHGTTCINGIIAMAVFCNDHEKFDYAVRAFKNEPGVDGNGCYSANTYIHASGQNNESARDQPHASGGVGGLVNSAMIAYNQNLDLFGFENNRLLAGVEHLAKFNLWYDEDPVTFVDCAGAVHNKLSTIGRRPNQNVSFNTAIMYYEKKGLNLPYSKMLANVNYPTQFGDDFLFRIDNSATIPSFVVPRASEPTDVQVYNDGSFGGGLIRHLAAGNYTTSALSGAGIVNNSASSIRIPAGWYVELYDNDNFTGTPVILKESSSFLGEFSLNDKVSSMKVFNTGGNTFKQIFAEGFNSKNDLTTELCGDADGRRNLVKTRNNSYASFNNVDINGATGFKIRTAGNAGTVEVRIGGIGGTLLTSLPVAASGGSQTWITTTGTFPTAASGNQTIYLVFKGGSSNLCSVHWFRFTK
ncbi:carbohydrate-binding protein [Pedobacter rhodius]|uniref:Carbohydrate-binding protein n=1 Tax=Pedobacter rhodius TaxID=3004098 RepID=A0ABT4KWZ6_9SPHI|nr:carbohydrate-binding protein [Pedobacter sp. SJ11]MCZ4223463.1 carbohydrate-binding protein [Pedobacter sp. SJ11]